MISFVWLDDNPVYSGRGGSENYIVGHAREMLRRGIEARIITVGLGQADGRQFFRDIPFHSVDSLDDLSELDDTLILINRPHTLKTKRPYYSFFHVGPIEEFTHQQYLSAAANSTVLVNSRHMRDKFSDYLDLPLSKIHVVYPFADEAFAKVKRVKFKSQSKRVLFAGRLVPHKGIYLLLEALHHAPLSKDFTFTVTTAGNQTADGKMIEKFLRHHPGVRVIQARHTPRETAQLFGRYDIVVVPSNHQFWQEPFGMISVEAQHAGCRVVASNSGGLPETNCGELILFKPGNSLSLAHAIQHAARVGPVTRQERQQAARHFTLQQSVDALLKIIYKTV